MTYLNIRYSLIAKLQQSLGKKYVVVQSWIQVIPLGAGALSKRHRQQRFSKNRMRFLKNPWQLGT